MQRQVVRLRDKRQSRGVWFGGQIRHVISCFSTGIGYWTNTQEFIILILGIYRTAQDDVDFSKFENGQHTIHRIKRMAPVQKS